MTEKRFAADARSWRDSASELKVNLEDCASLTHFLVKEADLFRGLAGVSLFGGHLHQQVECSGTKGSRIELCQSLSLAIVLGRARSP